MCCQVTCCCGSWLPSGLLNHFAACLCLCGRRSQISWPCSPSPDTCCCCRLLMLSRSSMRHLSCLAWCHTGRKTGGKITGDVRINGHPKEQDSFARISGYVEQVHSPTHILLVCMPFWVMPAWLCCCCMKLKRLGAGVNPPIDVGLACSQVWMCCCNSHHAGMQLPCQSCSPSALHPAPMCQLQLHPCGLSSPQLHPLCCSLPAV